MYTCLHNKKASFLKGLAKKAIPLCFFFFFLSKNYKAPTLSWLPLWSFSLKKLSFTDIRSFNNLGGRPWLTQLKASCFNVSPFIRVAGRTLIIHPHSFTVYINSYIQLEAEENGCFDDPRSRRDPCWLHGVSAG